MKLLVHEGKHEHRYILFQSGVDEDAAWLAMFRVFDEWEHFYEGLDESEAREDTHQRKLYHRAKRGNMQCARLLLQDRSGGEYESVYVEDIYTPASLLGVLDQ